MSAPGHSDPQPQQFSSFAETIMKAKYAHDLGDGQKETWEEVAHRVATTVMKSVGAKRSLVNAVERAIAERKFMPGGRYLYATGRAFHQTQNCLLLRADDSREGWSELMQKATMALMTGAGIGIDYSDVRPKGSRIRKTGRRSHRPNGVDADGQRGGRYIMQGGSRRSAIWAASTGSILIASSSWQMKNCRRKSVR
jgi:ribonucleoside-diphosphate reductase alpha chain